MNSPQPGYIQLAIYRTYGRAEVRAVGPGGWTTLYYGEPKRGEKMAKAVSHSLGIKLEEAIYA
jgi:hypothetical protein